MRNYKSLLPSHKSADEKTLEKIGANLLAKLDLSVIDNNPRTCDKRLLKHLAYQYDVDINNLSESEARALLSNAFLIHRYTGSAYAIKKALSAYDENLSVIEHENFSFSVKLKLKNDTSKEKLENILKLINKYKNVRSIFTKLDTTYECDLKIYSGIAIRTIQKITLQPKLETKLKADFNTTCINHLRIQERIRV